MRLTDRLPDRVTVDGKTYRCDFDFRNVLRLIDETGREDILPEARVYRALKCVMRRPPRDDILCAHVYVEVRKVLFPGADRKTEAKKLTDFDQDADLIRDSREGKYIFYELNASVLEEILLWITELKGE